MANIQIPSKNASMPERAAKRQAQLAFQEYDAALANLADNWSGLNANQKIEAVRAGLVILMKAVRFLMLRAAK